MTDHLDASRYRHMSNAPQFAAPQFAIEIVTGSIAHGNAAWVRCEEDGEEFRAWSRAEAEAMARFSLDEGTEWRVVEVQS